ncbi:MAG: sigma-70 family RNA polymerase sigma factor [Phascolarctobacterium sp.]|nr:sigma-70 family RNA polymerase sigma factor [Phascolarctobacterium sp.]
MLQKYLEELRKTKLLQPDEEYSLWEKTRAGDTEAHRKLMTSYQPLVFKIAISFALPEAETMELIQEGMVGLLEAAGNYDHTRGVAFSIFASYRIKGCMMDFLKKISWKGRLYPEGETTSGVILGDTLVSADTSPLEIVEQQMLQEKVALAIERLPQKEQMVLTGIYLEDKTAKTLADAIDISPGHVYRLQKQGVRRVRSMLSKFIHELNKE